MSTNISTIVKNSGNLSSNIAAAIKGNGSALYKLAVVVDIILDDKHPFFGKTSDNINSQPPPTIKYQQLPVNYENTIPSPSDTDYSYIGRAKIRILGEEQQTAYEKLPWAIAIDNTVTQLPLINEQVLVLNVGETYYYTKPFNRLNYLGSNGDFVTEKSNSDNNKSAVPYLQPPNRKSYVSHPAFQSINQNGYFGNYFILNPFIRSIRSPDCTTTR